MQRPFIFACVAVIAIIICISGQIRDASADCPWSNTADEEFGAPTPTFTGRVERTGNDYNVVMEVTMAKPNNSAVMNIRHLAALESSRPECTDVIGEGIYAGWELIDDAECSVTYQLNRTLQEHVDDVNTIKTFNGGDFFVLTSNMYAIYLNDEGATCSTIEFTAEYHVQVFLFGDAVGTFDADGTAFAKVYQSRIRMLPTGQLDIELRVSMLYSPATLANFTFVNAESAEPIVFNVNDASESPVDCGLNEASPKCVYLLSATTNETHTDYSGTFTFNADYSTGSAVVEDVNIQFTLQYAVPTPPPVSSLNVSTVVTFWEPNFAAEKSSFTTLDTTWVLQNTVPSFTVPGARLQIDSAYLCCLKSRQPYPEFEVDNPSKPGCTVNNPEIMASWSELLVNAAPNDPLFNPKQEEVPFGYTDKAGMSFDLFALQDSALEYGTLMCYVHAKAVYVDDVVVRDVVSKMAVSNKREELVAVSPVLITPTAVKEESPLPSDSDETSGAASRIGQFSSSILLLSMALISMTFVL